MRKILILYFSGTGNTDYISHYIYYQLTTILDNTIEITLSSIETFDVNGINEYELIIFGFPIFELSCPGFVKEYLKNLPVGDKKGVYIFATMGMAAGNAFRKVFRYFKSKNYVFLGAKSIKIAGTDGLMMMKESAKYVQKAIKRDYDDLPELDIFINKMSDTVKEWGKKSDNVDISDYKKKLPLSISAKLFGWAFHLLYLLSVIYMKKRFWVDDNCTQCEICVKICPTQNISLQEGKICFNDKCTMCLRCIHNCPEEAIQIGKMSVGKYRWHGPKGQFKPLKIIKK